VPILILGETGSGKSALARALHEDCIDRDAPFMTVNCAALPPARLAEEVADGSGAGAGSVPAAGHTTLFLDQVDALTTGAQATLLGLPALDARPAGPGGRAQSFGRIVAAGSHNLAARVRAGRFREDLYHRIAGMTVEVPALRDRTDLDLAIERVFRDEARRAVMPPPRIDPVVLHALRSHDWPGNFRELRYVARIAIAVADGEPITLAALPATLQPSAPTAPGARADRQRAAIESALESAQWNVRHAAQLLHISRATLHHRIRTFELRRPGKGWSTNTHPSAT